MSRMLAYRGLPGEPVPRLVEVARPEVGDHDVLVKIASAGLTAGTFTLHRAGLLKPMPMTLGHEGAGTVAAVGREVRSVKPGDRVRIHPTLSCGTCRYCRSDRDHMCPGAAIMGFVAFGAPVPAFERYYNGFLAEYATAPASHVDKLADDVSFAAGAKLHYLGNAARALRSADLTPGSTVAILAPTGAMGVATIKLAPVFGVSRLVLIGRSSRRLGEVQALCGVETDVIATDELGPDWATTGALPSRLGELLPGGADAMINYLPEGDSPLWQALTGLATGGALVNMVFGPRPIAAPMNALVGKCWRMVGTRNHSRLDATEALRLLNERVVTLDEVITHRRPLADIDAAVGELQARAGTVWMSVVEPG